MGLFRRPSPVASKREAGWFPTASGQPLIAAAFYNQPNTDRALSNAATWACIDVLSGAISRTPFDVVRYVGDRRVAIPNQPKLITNPSALITDDVWRAQMASSMLTDGNAFGLITSWRNGWPDQIEPVSANVVMQRGVEDGYAVATIDNVKHRLFPNGDLFHIPGRMVVPGSPFGLSPILYAAKSIGTSLGAEDYANQFFESGGHQTAIITSDEDIDADEAGAIKSAWRRSTSGNREPLILGSSLKYEAIQSKPDDSSPVDLMRFEVEQSCRFWAVPPSMVFGAVSGSSVTYANVTDADWAFLKHSLEVYLTRIERALSNCLPAPQKVKANRNAIMVSDPPARHALYAARLAAKTMTVNEVRALEDEPPFVGAEFDKPGVPSGPPPIAMPPAQGSLPFDTPGAPTDA
jgi:HK97 family phage portal protein